MFSQMCFSKYQNSLLLPKENVHNQNWFSDNTPCCSCLYTVSPGNTDNGFCQPTNAATALFHIFGLKALLAPEGAPEINLSRSQNRNNIKLQMTPVPKLLLIYIYPTGFIVILKGFKKSVFGIPEADLCFCCSCL